MSAEKPTIRGLGGEPRVQLIPPFVKQRAQTRAAIRLGLFFAAIGAVVAVGLFGFGFVRAAAAQVALASANQETQTILLQQQDFRIATDTSTMVDQTRETQRSATSYEIFWAPVLAQIEGMLPKDAKLQSLEIEARAPWDAPLNVEDPLRTPRIATFAITVSTKSIPEAVAFQQRLSELTGYADSVVQSTAVGVDGRASTVIALTLSTDAVTGRYVGNDQPVTMADMSGDGTSTDTAGSSDTGTAGQGG